MQVLLLAQVAGVLKLGNICLDGTKIHADASKSKAVSYKHLLATHIIPLKICSTTRTHFTQSIR